MLSYIFLYVIQLTEYGLTVNTDGLIEDREVFLYRQSYHTHDGLLVTTPQLLSGSKDLCQKVEDMLGAGGLLHRQHVIDVGNDVIVVAAAATSTTFSRDVRLPVSHTA